MWEWAHGGGAASAGGSSYLVGAVPAAYPFFITDGGSATEVKDLTDARLMAAMPPRTVASLLFLHSYCI
jgi:hypothetical protein